MLLNADVAKVDTALARLTELLPLEGRKAACSPRARALHSAILWSFFDNGRASSPDEIADAVGKDNVAAVTAELASLDMVTFTADGDPIGAYPFTTDPREHRVWVNGHQVHAMCSVDALAIAAMFETETTIESTCRATGAPLTIHMQGATVTNESQCRDVHVAVAWSSADAQSSCSQTLCTDMVFLRDADVATAWNSADPDGREVFTLPQAVEFGRRFFSPLVERRHAAEDDPFQATAGFYHLMAEDYVEAQLAALAELLGHVDPSAGPLLDVGCGSGRLLEHALAELPQLHAIGVEPSPAMRSLAFGRFTGHPQWRDRITIRPEGALEAPLPEHLSGVIMLGVFGYFNQLERGQLLARLASRLPAGAAILLDFQMPEEPREVPRYRFTDHRLGTLRYQGFAQGSPIGGEAMRWEMTYRTLDGDTVLEERVTHSTFHHPRHGLVGEEMREHGLRLTRLADTTFWLATRDS
ncbi:MAG: organomercurial lyase [Arachnia sp.]